jgi:hypothetical protein
MADKDKPETPKDQQKPSDEETDGRKSPFTEPDMEEADSVDQ